MDKINRIFLQVEIDPLGTGAIQVVAVPLTGHVKNVWVTNELIAAGADEVITVTKNTAAGVNSAMQVFTLVDTTADGTTTKTAVAKAAASLVEAGGSLEVANSGASTNAGSGSVLFEITI